jgi:hypothetical protein
MQTKLDLTTGSRRRTALTLADILKPIDLLVCGMCGPCASASNLAAPDVFLVQATQGKTHGAAPKGC